MFGYILRTVLQRIVIQAVKIENDGELRIMTKAISLNAYKQAAANVRGDIIKSAEHWFDEIQAFQTYIIEQDTLVEMSKIKEVWDQLGILEKKDFICRVKAESDFKDQIKKFKAKEETKKQEYTPKNYYGTFIKKQIEDLEKKVA